jgi:hypothetical protein
MAVLVQADPLAIEARRDFNDTAIRDDHRGKHP